LRTAELDAWLPEWSVRTHHRREAAASPEALWEAAGRLRLDETRRLGRLVRWRIPGTPADLPFRELLASYPFVVLQDGADWSLSGLCGRIWTLNRDYPRLEGPEAFRAWSEPGTVRVLFANWVEPRARGRAVLVSETRVAPTDRAAAVRLRSLWLVIGVFERLIGTEPLQLAAQRAEQARRPARTRSASG
jgi:hypothetical protein